MGKATLLISVLEDRHMLIETEKTKIKPEKSEKPKTEPKTFDFKEFYTKI